MKNTFFAVLLLPCVAFAANNAEGTSCKVDADCAANLYCSPSKVFLQSSTCASKKQLKASCSKNAECQSAACDASLHTCVDAPLPSRSPEQNRLTANAPCTATLQCRQDLFCSSDLSTTVSIGNGTNTVAPVSTCMWRGRVNEPCKTNAQCMEGLECSSNSKCNFGAASARQLVSAMYVFGLIFFIGFLAFVGIPFLTVLLKRDDSRMKAMSYSQTHKGYSPSNPKADVIDYDF